MFENIQTLPLDILQEVFSHFDEETLLITQYVSRKFFDVSWTHRSSIDFVRWPRQVRPDVCRRVLLNLCSPNKIRVLRLPSFFHASQSVLVPHLCQQLTHLQALAIKSSGPKTIVALAANSLQYFSECLLELDIRNCSIDDRGMSAIAQSLTSLTLLNLAGCRAITDAGVSALSSCDALIALSLDSTPVLGMCFQYLNTLTNLSILRLKHCHNLIEGATEQIAVLTALRKLDLSYTPTKQLPSLPALTNLEKLNIGHTNVTDAGLVDLSCLVNLVELSVEKCPALTALTLDRASKSLVKLHVLNLSGSLVPRLADLPRLPQLIAIAHNATLRVLILSKCRIDDHDLELVSELVSLRILQLSRCDLITTKGVAHLGTLTNLEHLGLNHCTEVQYEVVAYFGNLKKLKVLEMAHISADTSGVGLRILTRLKALRSFHVRVVSSRGVDLSDAAFGAIGFMTQLSTLRLSGSTSEALNCIPQWLQRLTALQHFKMAGNAVSNELLMRVGMSPCRQLSSLIIDSNLASFSSTGVSYLGHLSALRTLAIANASNVGDFDFMKRWEDNGLPIVTSLTKLTFRNAPCFADAMLQISSLKNLKELSLFCAGRLTDSGVRRLASLRHLRRLDVTASIQVSSEGIIDLINWSRSLKRVVCLQTKASEIAITPKLTRQCKVISLKQ